MWWFATTSIYGAGELSSLSLRVGQEAIGANLIPSCIRICTGGSVESRLMNVNVPTRPGSMGSVPLGSVCSPFFQSAPLVDDVSQLNPPRVTTVL